MIHGWPLTDRVGGALLLLYGQQLSRITALTTEQLHRRGEQVFLRLGRDEITVPEPLAGLLTALARDTGGDWNRYAAQLIHTHDHQP